MESRARKIDRGQVVHWMVIGVVLTAIGLLPTSASAWIFDDRCAPKPTASNLDEFKAPNALIMLDRSGSMSQQGGGGMTRWEAAKKAIDEVGNEMVRPGTCSSSNFRGCDKIRFGLGLFWHGTRSYSCQKKYKEYYKVKEYRRVRERYKKYADIHEESKEAGITTAGQDSLFEFGNYPTSYPDKVKVQVELWGDYGQTDEYADVSVNGNSQGRINPGGADCNGAAHSKTWTLPGSVTSSGTVKVRVKNSGSVKARCSTRKIKTTVSFWKEVQQRYKSYYNSHTKSATHDFTQDGENATFRVEGIPAYSGTLKVKLRLTGDYGSSNEYADVWIGGAAQARHQGGADCGAASEKTYEIPGSAIQNEALTIRVDNSGPVQTLCTTNRVEAVVEFWEKKTVRYKQYYDAWETKRFKQNYKSTWRTFSTSKSYNFRRSGEYVDLNFDNINSVSGNMIKARVKLWGDYNSGRNSEDARIYADGNFLGWHPGPRRQCGGPEERTFTFPASYASDGKVTIRVDNDRHVNTFCSTDRTEVTLEFWNKKRVQYKKYYYAWETRRYKQNYKHDVWKHEEEKSTTFTRNGQDRTIRFQNYYPNNFGQSCGTKKTNVSKRLYKRWGGRGAARTFSFSSLPNSPDGRIRVRVRLHGDYNSSSEYARIYVDGNYVGRASGSGQCSRWRTQTFYVPASYATDGRLDVRVDNSRYVDYCSTRAYVYVDYTNKETSCGSQTVNVSKSDSKSARGSGPNFYYTFNNLEKNADGNVNVTVHLKGDYDYYRERARIYIDGVYKGYLSGRGQCGSWNSKTYTIDGRYVKDGQVTVRIYNDRYVGYCRTYSKVDINYKATTQGSGGTYTSTQKERVYRSGENNYLYFRNLPKAAANGKIKVHVYGDFGYSRERAYVYADGNYRGTVGGSGGDCRSGGYKREFSVDKSWINDGTLRVRVDNHSWVNTFCSRDEHIVTLEYPKAGSDLGEFIKVRVRLHGGDYNSSSEYANVYVDGKYVGRHQGPATSCSGYKDETYTVNGRYIQDGKLDVKLANSSAVGICGNAKADVKMAFWEKKKEKYKKYYWVTKTVRYKERYKYYWNVNSETKSTYFNRDGDNHTFTFDGYDSIGGNYVQVDVRLWGDYNAGSEYARIWIDGNYQGRHQGPRGQCRGSDNERYRVPSSWMSDGRLTVRVDNSYSVDDFCSTDKAEVTLTFWQKDRQRYKKYYYVWETRRYKQNYKDNYKTHSEKKSIRFSSYGQNATLVFDQYQSNTFGDTTTTSSSGTAGSESKSETYDFNSSGENFTVSVSPLEQNASGNVNVTVKLTGDYASSSEYAKIWIDGAYQGVHQGGSDCSTGSRTYSVPGSYVSDGRLDVRVDNSSYVGTFCNTNRARVDVNYTKAGADSTTTTSEVAKVKVTLYGDYNAGSEYANIYVDGNYVGRHQGPGNCYSGASETYTVSGTYIRDQKLNVRVDNSGSVGLCGQRKADVEVSYWTRTKQKYKDYYYVTETKRVREKYKAYKKLHSETQTEQFTRGGENKTISFTQYETNTFGQTGSSSGSTTTGVTVRRSGSHEFVANGGDGAIAFGGLTDAQGNVTVKVTLDGDYGATSEYARIYVDGTRVGTHQGGSDCNPSTASYSVPASYVADGQLNVRVENSGQVGTWCDNNTAKVNVRYTTPSATSTITKAERIRIKVELQGDYYSGSEYANIYADGNYLGRHSGSRYDCSSRRTQTFEVAGDVIRDGKLDVRIDNSRYVGICSRNRSWAKVTVEFWEKVEERYPKSYYTYENVHEKEQYKKTVSASGDDRLTYTWFNTGGHYNKNGHPNNAPELDKFFDDGTDGVSWGGTGTHADNIHWNEYWRYWDRKPGYLPAERFSWMVEGWVRAPKDGTYYFGVDGDDAVDVAINGQTVVGWYGGHGTSGTYGANYNHSGTIKLEAGWHRFRARMEEGGGGNGISVGWRIPGNGWQTIPRSYFSTYRPADTSPTQTEEFRSTGQDATLVFDQFNTNSYGSTSTSTGGTSSGGSVHEHLTKEFTTGGENVTLQFETLPTQTKGNVDVDVRLTGDYGTSAEYARVYIDGNYVGTHQGGSDCNSSTKRFSVSGSSVADGKLTVRVDNSSDVGTWCGTNEIRTDVRYDKPDLPGQESTTTEYVRAKVSLWGDYGQSSEYADIYVDGNYAGRHQGPNDCGGPSTKQFDVAGSVIQDGVVNVKIANSGAVQAACHPRSGGYDKAEVTLEFWKKTKTKYKKFYYVTETKRYRERYKQNYDTFTETKTEEFTRSGDDKHLTFDRYRGTTGNIIKVKVGLWGDYGSGSEYAWIYADGNYLGRHQGPRDCRGPDWKTFEIPSSYVGDGKLDIRVRNRRYVNICRGRDNKVQVVLEYWQKDRQRYKDYYWTYETRRYKETYKDRYTPTGRWFDGFEDRNVDDDGWRVYNHAWRLSGRDWGGNYSAYIYDWYVYGGYGQDRQAEIHPAEMQGGVQATQFRYYYYEYSYSDGGFVRLRDSDNRHILSIGTHNPHWYIQSGHGSRTYGGWRYNDWHRVTVKFDWNNKTADWEIRNMETGRTRSGTVPFADSRAKNLEELEVYSVSDDMHMWFDDFEVNWPGAHSYTKSKDFNRTGENVELTFDQFWPSTFSGNRVKVKVDLWGDYGASSEYARVYADGNYLGTHQGASDCNSSPSSQTWDLDSSIANDEKIVVRVDNSGAVNTGCSTNRVQATVSFWTKTRTRYKKYYWTYETRRYRERYKRNYTVSSETKSTNFYRTSQARTLRFDNYVSTGGNRIKVEVTLWGDYGSSSEYANIYADGNYVGRNRGSGRDCRGSRTTTHWVNDSYLADGRLDVRVDTSRYVNTFCSTNRAKVTISFYKYERHSYRERYYTCWNESYRCKKNHTHYYRCRKKYTRSYRCRKRYTRYYRCRKSRRVCTNRRYRCRKRRCYRYRYCYNHSHWGWWGRYNHRHCYYRTRCSYYWSWCTQRRCRTEYYWATCSSSYYRWSTCTSTYYRWATCSSNHTHWDTCTRRKCGYKYRTRYTTHYHEKDATKWKYDYRWKTKQVRVKKWKWAYKWTWTKENMDKYRWKTRWKTKQVRVKKWRWAWRTLWDKRVAQKWKYAYRWATKQVKVKKWKWAWRTNWSKTSGPSQWSWADRWKSTNVKKYDWKWAKSVSWNEKKLRKWSWAYRWATKQVKVRKWKWATKTTWTKEEVGKYRWAWRWATKQVKVRKWKYAYRDVWTRKDARKYQWRTRWKTKTVKERKWKWDTRKVWKERKLKKWEWTWRWATKQVKVRKWKYAYRDDWSKADAELWKWAWRWATKRVKVRKWKWATRTDWSKKQHRVWKWDTRTVLESRKVRKWNWATRYVTKLVEVTKWRWKTKTATCTSTGDHSLVYNPVKEDNHSAINTTLGNHSPGGSAPPLADAVKTLASDTALQQSDRTGVGILVTDGKPKNGQAVTAIEELCKLQNRSNSPAKTYVVGFSQGANTAYLDLLAAAGGTGTCCPAGQTGCAAGAQVDPCGLSGSALQTATTAALNDTAAALECRGSYEADHPSNLKQSLLKIAEDISCTYELEFPLNTYNPDEAYSDPKSVTVRIKHKQFGWIDVPHKDSGLLDDELRSQGVSPATASQYANEGWEFKSPATRTKVRFSSKLCGEILSGKTEKVQTQVACDCPDAGSSCTVPGRTGICATGQYACSIPPGEQTCEPVYKAGQKVPGSSCSVPGKKGRCAAGVWHCSATGTPICKPLHQPLPEICNGLDDDCDGTTDNIQTSWQKSWNLKKPGKVHSDFDGLACGGTSACICSGNMAQPDSEYRGRASMLQDEWKNLLTETYNGGKETTTCYCSE